MKYEFKYIVPVNQLEPFREAIRPYVEFDPYAASMKDHEYTVRSVYFDTSRFDYYFEKVDGYKVSKKIRIRGYNEKTGDDTVFMEIKRKFKEPIEKDRERLTFEVMKRLMAGEGSRAYGDVTDDHGVNGAGKFLFHVYRNNLKPVVLVIYEREAFFDRFKTDVRITIDKNLRSVAYPKVEDLYSEDKVVPAMKSSFILEVKFKDQFPGWMRISEYRAFPVKRLHSPDKPGSIAGLRDCHRPGVPVYIQRAQLFDNLCEFAGFVINDHDAGDHGDWQ
ncbi:MAG: polyphosphate polymerase domain-containing protein [Bacteroidales bacterium]|nr:polyphosphate polymerase domain-containing protein [Bacteroidales bacterium]